MVLLVVVLLSIDMSQSAYLDYRCVYFAIEDKMACMVRHRLRFHALFSCVRQYPQRLFDRVLHSLQNLTGRGSYPAYRASALQRYDQQIQSRSKRVRQELRQCFERCSSYFYSTPSRSLRRNCAFTATIIVDNDMKTAPSAGESIKPVTPVASGIATTL